MKHTSITAKAPLTFAGTVLLGVALAAPAAARPDPGSGDVGTPASELPYSQEAYENHYLSPLPEPVPSVTGSASYRFVDENGVQLLQLGAGVLAGVGPGGAGMAVASRRSHGHPRPPGVTSRRHAKSGGCSANRASTSPGLPSNPRFAGRRGLW